MNDKSTYRQFCRQEATLPVFFQDWYLDAVCYPGRWDVVMVYRNDRLAGVLPYYYKRKWWFRYLTMPHLCFVMGPYLTEDFREQRDAIVSELWTKLPHFDFVEQRWHYSIRTLPANVAQQQIRSRYSYRLEDLSDLKKVYGNITRNYRNNKIKKALKLVSVHHNLPAAECYRINKMSFDRQGVPIPYSLDFFLRMDAALAQHGARRIFAAVDGNHQIHSVLYLIWDRKSSYLHLAGDDPALRKSGASILLIWEAIQFTKNELGLQVFDFEGSMIPSVERVRKDFGASRKFYYQINTERSVLFRWASRLKTRLKK